MLGRFLLDPQGGEGGNGTTETKPVPAPAPEPEKGPDLGKAVEGLVAKHGDPAAALRILLGENYGYRDQLREAKAKLPGEGAVVLTGDHAKEWESYRAIGKPADLKAALAERDSFKAESSTLRKAETVRAAAELHGYKPAVLATLAKDREITIGDRVDKDGKPVLKDGKPIKAAFVKGEGENAKLVPLDDHAKAEWADFLPSLALVEVKSVGTPRVQGNRPVPTGQGSGEPKRRTVSF